MSSLSLVVLAALVALAVLALEGHGASATPARRCRSQMGLEFADAAPQATPLDFCADHMHATCCNGTHASIIRRRYLSLGEELSSECRRAWLSVLCLPCHRDVGTATMRHVCPSLCSTIYAACANDWFTVANPSGPGPLGPCETGALVCGRLSAMVDSPGAMCARAGMTLAPSPGVHASGLALGALDGVAESVRRARTGERESTDESCYDGAPAVRPEPSARTRRPPHGSAVTSMLARLGGWRAVAAASALVLVAAFVTCRSAKPAGGGRRLGTR